MKKKKEEKTQKICLRCKHPINEKSNFYSFTEWNNKNVVSVDYAHRICWDEFLKQIGDTTKAMSMLKRLEEPLINMGLLKPEVVKI